MRYINQNYLLKLVIVTNIGVLIIKPLKQLSRDMRFPTMWYVRPAKPQTSLRIRAV